VPLEGHGQVGEVPQDRPKGAQQLYPKDDVKAVQWEDVAANVEIFLVDGDRQLRTYPVATDMLPIGNLDRETRSGLHPEAQLHRHLLLDERMRRSGVH
jgi:hypothetical protein